MLTIPLEKLAYIIQKARGFDAEVLADEDQAGSNGSDDGEAEILLDTADNPTAEELRDAIDGLNVDERAELLALTWLGRGDFDRSGWPEALRAARQATNLNEVDYLMGTPLLADYLEEAVAALGLSVQDYQIGRL